MALVLAGAQLRIASRDILVLALHRHNADVPLMGRLRLLRGRLGSNAAVAAAEADSVHGDVIDHSAVVDIGDARGIDIVH
jgi:hypothetical protein